ncbi:MAG: hypothetical protein SVT52_03645 [Planctomycetota bacterium]|nr:hypothetical protein [Planctomycetota bacterium]
MKMKITILSLLLFASSAFGEQTLREVSWSQLQADGRLANGRLLPEDDQSPFESLVVENTTSEPVTVTVLAIGRPDITTATYAIRGQVRYEQVEGEGYIEMWSIFPGGERCFSRTLGARGLLQSLDGSSPWRPFALPFFVHKSTDRPEKLIVNVVLPGSGRVYLSSLRLVQYDDGEDPLAVAGQWWSDRTGGAVGGTLGATVGLLGAMVGVLCSLGRGRAFVLALMKVMIAVGAAGLVIGVVAVIQSQPYAVYYPLLLCGVIAVAVFGGLLGVVRRRFEQLELRKMSAMDAG